MVKKICDLTSRQLTWLAWTPYPAAQNLVKISSKHLPLCLKPLIEPHRRIEEALRTHTNKVRSEKTYSPRH